METVKSLARKLRAILNIIRLRTFLNHIEFEVAEHCNLNCKACSHFSNICEQKFIDVRVLEHHFDRLNKLFGFIYNVCILGGEPLLHPDIADIIKPTRRKFPQGINIYSSSAKQILNYLKVPEETCKYCMVVSNYIDWTCSYKPKETDWYGIHNGKETE